MKINHVFEHRTLIFQLYASICVKRVWFKLIREKSEKQTFLFKNGLTLCYL